jgi:hypothetical protein
VSLVWCVPVVASAVAAALVALHARPLEDAGRELTESVARLSELRWRFAQLRVAARETDARVVTFRERRRAADAQAGDPADDGAGHDGPDGPRRDG